MCQDEVREITVKRTSLAAMLKMTWMGETNVQVERLVKSCWDKEARDGDISLLGDSNRGSEEWPVLDIFRR